MNSVVFFFESDFFDGDVDLGLFIETLAVLFFMVLLFFDKFMIFVQL